MICRFWTLLAGATGDEDRILSLIIDLARAKLICRQKIACKVSEISETASTAVLDVLINLDFEPRREAARRLEADLVASHMRTAFSVPKHREYLRSGYPSEPILAEAAASQMDEFQTRSDAASMMGGVHHPNVMANILQSNFTSGLLNQGERGEVVFRQLISEAYRRSVRTDHPDDYPRIFSKGCKLTTFITELFSKDYADQILDSVPDNVKSTTKFAEAFDDAIVRFTHFGRMADDTGTTSYAMFAAFVRCMAIICWSSQDVVDILLPTLLKRGDTIQESNMTAVCIQIKRRKVKGSVVRYEIDQRAIGLFPPSPTDIRPYITLVAELGVQLPISKAATTKAIVRENLIKFKEDVDKPRTTTKRKAESPPGTPSEIVIPEQPVRIAHPKDVHPRYSIFVYGCSDTGYKVIKHSERSLYKLLLGNHDFLDEHPRDDNDSLDAVRRMKPFWSVGHQCYHWTDVPFLRKG
jgi:hypothetical protein